MNLSKNFTLLELTHSQEATRAGLDNTPTAEHIKSLNLSVEEVIGVIRKLKLPVDQCINEYGQWIHISHKRNRNQFLEATKKDHKVIYKPTGEAHG